MPPQISLRLLVKSCDFPINHHRQRGLSPQFSATTFQPRGKGFVRRWPKAPPHGASANTPYPFARTFAPPPHCRRVHNTLPTLQDAIRLYSDHYNPLQAKWRRRRGRSRFTRSNAPQRLEAREWESCRTTDGMSFASPRPQSFPRDTNRNESQAPLQDAASAASLQRRDHASASHW